MQFINRLLPLLFLFSTSPLCYSQNFDDVKIEAHQLTENIYMLTGQGGNIGLSVGPDGTFMIDDQYAPLSEKIQKAISEITDQPVRYLINTHWHGDHSGGNENFANAGAVIVAHENVRKRMSSEQLIAAFSKTVPPSPEAALPVITFSNDLSMHLNGEEIMIMHLHQAHTDGDAIIYFANSNILHMGDTFFNGMYPFIDISTGGSIEGMIKNANQVLFLVDDETKIIPGHGPLAAKKDLVAYRDMLQTLRDGVKNALAKGMSLEEIQKTVIADSIDEKWGQGYLKSDQILNIVYSDLSREK